MIRRYCDLCGQEISGSDNAVTNRIKVRHGRLLVEVIVGMDSTWNRGDACRACVREAIRVGETLCSALVTKTAQSE